MTVLKTVRINDELAAKVQAIAEERFDGNFSAALLDCALCGIKMMEIPEDVRLAMKSGMMRHHAAAEYYDENTRAVIDALQI